MDLSVVFKFLCGLECCKIFLKFFYIIHLLLEKEVSFISSLSSGSVLYVKKVVSLSSEDNGKVDLGILCVICVL
jgi:hypothetical protein